MSGGLPEAAFSDTVRSVVIDSLIIPECIFRPGSFTGLMTIYESNYIKLRQLTTSFHWQDGAMLSSAPRDCDLHGQVLRREAYTTTLQLTYWFEEPNGVWVPDPDLTLRVYHDARLVEAVAGREGQGHRHHKLRELAGRSSAELDRRWRMNMMLNKWLDYLFEVGHALRGPAEQPLWPDP